MREGVCVGVVYPRDGVSSEFWVSLVHLREWDFHTNKNIHAWGLMPSGANICKARNEVVKKFLETDEHEWLLLIDTDMTFDEHLLSGLLEAADPEERPVVGALCFMLRSDDDNTKADPRFRRGHLKPFPTLYARGMREDGSVFYGQWPTYPKNRLMEVAATGAACLLIHHTVLEKVEDVQENKADPFTWFREELVGKERLGEDLSFMNRLWECNVPVYVHTGIKCGHVKATVFDEANFSEEMKDQEGRFVIIGAPQAGLQWLSKTFTASGLICGFEWMFQPTDRPEVVGLPGDASWVAMPALEAKEAHADHVVHLIRNPLHMALMAIEDGFPTEDPEDVYSAYAHAFGDMSDGICGFLADWLERCEKMADQTVRIEDLRKDPAIIADMIQIFSPDMQVTDDHVRTSIAAIEGQIIPENLLLSPKAGFREAEAGSWDDLPDGLGKEALMGFAERHKYLG